MELIGRTDVPSPFAAPLAQQSLEERLALMDAYGIERQVLSLSQAQPYMEDRVDSVAAAQLANDLYDELCRRHDERFSTFAALPLPHVGDALDEIERVSSRASVVGFTMGCSINGLQIDSELLDPVYEALHDRSAVLFLHPVGQTDVAFLQGHNLAWSVGATFEDTAAALRLVYADVPRRFNKMKVIVPHLGGTLPFLIDRLTRKGGADTIKGLRSFYYDTVSGSLDALNCTRNAVGSDHLLFGTDYPFCDEKGFERHLTYLDEADMSVEELDFARGRRAADLLGLAEVGDR
jgi:aminocarboxymuconate-semialdehyde decarboxylase